MEDQDDFGASPEATRELLEDVNDPQPASRGDVTQPGGYESV